MATKPDLRVLVVDDNDDDAQLLIRHIRKGGFAVAAQRVCTAAELRDALAEPWDVVLCDWSMPGFGGLTAFRIVRERGLDVPFIITSGTIDDAIAATALEAGVHDFVGKANLARLVPAIERELREVSVRRRQRDGEDRYRAMFDASPLPMWTFDPDTLRFVEVNAAAIRHYGYSRDELLAMTIADIRSEADVDRVRASVRSRGRGQRVWQHRTKDGTTIWVDVRASDLVVDGRRLRLVLAQDVSDRERPAKRPVALWVGFALFVIVGVLAAVSSQRLAERTSRVDHTYAAIQGLEAIGGAIDELDALRRAYALTGDDHELRRFAAAKGVVAAALVTVRNEVEADLDVDTARQQRQLDDLHALVIHRLASLDAAVAQRRDLGFDLAREADTVRAGAAETEQVHAQRRSIVVDEERLLEDERIDVAHQVVYERVAIGGGISLGLVVLSLVFVRLSREAQMRRRAEQAAREGEDELATTLMSIGDGVIATDRDRRIVRMNPVAERLTGWSESAAAGQSFADVFRIVHRATREPASDPTGRVLRDGTVTGLDEDVVLVARDGRETAVADSAAPIRDGEGRVTGAVVVFRDASAEREWERRLSEANAQLERRVEERTAALQRTEDQLRQSQKLEAIGRLAGGIAHDFNNLLSVVLSYSDMLAEEMPDGEHKDDVVEIRKAGLRAADLTRQLLAFSRQQVLAPKVVDLNTVLGGMEKLLRRVIGEDIELRFTAKTAIGRVKVDPGQIEQVIMNLVVNARDAMPRGGTLTIETANADLDESGHINVAPGRYVMIAVTDTGIGMDKDTQARIFEPFFTTKPKGKGTGLGLSTVFGIVQQSRGHVWVYSEPGIGSSFKVYLPQTDEAGDVVDAVGQRVKLRGSGTILLVEDEDQVRTLARTVLGRAGYDVLEASNGEEALAIANRFDGRIHLVVTDVVMPKMSGRELVEKLAARRPDSRVLFMSGYTDDTVVHHGVLDAGVAFLQKPLTPDTLTRKVREVLS